MARKPRVHFPGALYHVIARGNQKQDIFYERQDYLTYLSYLSHYKTRYPFQLYAYALMRNHVHLLMEIGTTPLSKVMQTLQFRYTRYFNSKYDKVGHLFQGRYKAILCDKDSYLLKLIRYIHLNPIRSGFVKDPGKYPWVSHSDYLGRENNGLIEEDFVLGQFGKEKSVALRNYQKFIWDGLDMGHQKEFYEVKDQRFLGQNEFVERVESGNRGWAVFYDVPLEAIVTAVSQQMEIPFDHMFSQTRNRQGAYGRGLAAYLGRRVSAYAIVDMAHHFRRNPMVISQAIAKVEKLISGDGKLAKRIERMEKELVQGRKKKYFVTNA